MMKWSMTNKLALIVLYGVAQLMAFHATANESKASVTSSEAESTGKVRLSLKTDKSTYKLDEPVQLSIQLENIGKEPIYIADHLDLDSHISGFYMKLDVFLSDGTLAPYERYVADAARAGPYPKDVNEIIKTYYRLLVRKYFYGKTEVIYPKERGMTKKGKYMLVVTYYNSEPTKWSGEEKADLKYYVVGGKLKSNEVWIKIIP